MGSIIKTGAVAVGSAALVVSGIGFGVPAEAAGGITIADISYPVDTGFAELEQPLVDLNCGFEVEFSDSTPGASYEVLLAPDPGVDAFAEFNRASRTGQAWVDCGHAPDALQSGQIYTVTIQEYSVRGTPAESVSTEFTYTEVSAPANATVVVDGVPVGDTLPTGVPIDIAFEGGDWEPGTTFHTLVSTVPAEYFEDETGETEPTFVPVLSSRITGDAPVSRFTIPHHFRGDPVWISMRAEKAGKAPVVIFWDEPWEIVLSPATQQFPAAWVRTPGAKSGAAFAGTPVGVSAPSFTHTGTVAELRPYYQWYLDGAVVPGAKSRTYTPPANAIGRKLTLGIAFAAPGYLTRTGTFNFGTVGQRSVPAAWVRTPAVKSGTARAGSTVSVSAPVLTSTAVAQGTKVYYQWFLDGRAIPGAKSRTYTVTSAARGKTLTVGIAVAKPLWKPLNSTLSFGKVR